MSEAVLPICVIEDNTPIRRLFCTILKKAGYETVDFADGFSSIDYLKESPVAGIIMDILLPDLNGTELIAMVRDLPNVGDVPIIAVTGFAQANDRERFIQLGFDSYIAKPVNTATFVSEVKTIFDSKSKS
jgi:CheY-like chemotaxis protein